MANIIVLGAGLVGGIMAKDLAQDHNVTCVDISQKNLNKLSNINTICSDIQNTEKLQGIPSRWFSERRTRTPLSRCKYTQ